MWWHGGAGITERSERGKLSAVATHGLFSLLILFGVTCRRVVSSECKPAEIMNGTGKLLSTVSAICNGGVESLLGFADGYTAESVRQNTEELLKLGLGSEFFNEGLKLVIDIAPVDKPELMHDPGALFLTVRYGKLTSTLGGVITEGEEDGIGKGDAMDVRLAVGEQRLTEDVGRNLHSLENRFYS